MEAQSAGDAGSKILLTERSAGVATLTLNRPERRNALSLALLIELHQQLAKIAEDRSLRVVVIAGSGPVFSSGHDLSEMTGRSEAEYRQLFETCSRTMMLIRELPQPVIARVHGTATAAGCQLVAACDLVVATEDARFATPGVKIGLFCSTPMVPLVRCVPAKVAMKMLLTGDPIDARQALTAGLVSEVVPAAQLDKTVDRLARAIAQSSATVTALGKRAFYRLAEVDERAAYERATDIITRNALEADAQEGISAFLQKRSPVWKS